MRKYFSVSFLIVSAFLFCSCDRVENRFIYIENHSTQNVISFISKKDMTKMSKISDRDAGANIKANNFGAINPVRIQWDDYVKSCEEGKIRIYIIEENIVSKYGLINILKKNIYNKKYVYSIKDLENINWKITYNPDGLELTNPK